MDLLGYLKGRDGAVVIVDDDFEAPVSQPIDNDDRAALYELLDEDDGARGALCALLGMPAESAAGDVVKAAELSRPLLWSM
jgi:hypothetical protein